jgi:adenosylhomocysteinase
MDGFMVMPMEKAAEIGEIFITTTGNTSVLTSSHFPKMRNGVVLANAGHFNVEIDIQWLEKHARAVTKRDGIDTYRVDKKDIHVLAEGRLVNLAIPKGMGHPIEVMDLSFALQALCARYIVMHGRSLQPGVYDVPVEIDDLVARKKLAALSVAIDELSPAQTDYLSGWNVGT